MENRRCSKCKTEKPLSDFHRTSQNKVGRQAQCKVCTKAYRVAHYQKNKERQQTLNREWIRNNKEKFKQIKQDYKQRGRAKSAAEKDAEYAARTILSPKTCTTCNQEKTLDKFPNGHARCKTCKKIYQSEWFRQNSERILSTFKEHYDPIKQRRKRTQQTYNLSPAMWDALFDSQGRKCAICKRDKSGGRGGWHTDHDHSCCPGIKSCGRCVRGILCHWCNVGTGNLKDSRAILVSAIAYLDSPPARRVFTEPELFGDQR